MFCPVVCTFPSITTTTVSPGTLETKGIRYKKLKKKVNIRDNAFYLSLSSTRLCLSRSSNSINTLLSFCIQTVKLPARSQLFQRHLSNVNYITSIGYYTTAAPCLQVYPTLLSCKQINNKVHGFVIVTMDVCRSQTSEGKNGQQ